MSVFFYGYADHRDLHLLTHSFPTRRLSDLSDLKLNNINFSAGDFSYAILRGTDFSGSRFVLADLRGAMMLNANFATCNLQGAKFDRAIMTNADFRGAKLSPVSISGAKNRHQAARLPECNQLGRASCRERVVQYV